MNKKVKVWGRDFQLKVIFDTYDYEEITNMQKEALNTFVDTADKLLSSCDELKKYCIKKDENLIADTIENIFKYVIPTTLYVGRNTNKRVVSLLCNYRFDEENGIAITYENEKLMHIGSQDDVL